MTKSIATALLLGFATVATSASGEASSSAAVLSAATPTDAASAPARAWAYTPVKRPAVPAVKQKAWVRTPVDAFVLAKLEA